MLHSSPESMFALHFEDGLSCRFAASLGLASPAPPRRYALWFDAAVCRLPGPLVWRATCSSCSASDSCTSRFIQLLGRSRRSSGVSGARFLACGCLLPMAYGDSRVAVGSLLIRYGPVLAILLLAALSQLAVPLTCSSVPTRSPFFTACVLYRLASLLQLALPLALAVPPGRCGNAVQCVSVTSILVLVLRLPMRPFLYWYCA